MSLQDFESLSAFIEAIDEKTVVEPQMPVAIMLQESEDLYAWCQADKEILTKAGLDWTLVESLPKRVGSCRYIQSQWQKEYQSQQDSEKEWTQKSPIAFDLRDELLHHCFHAYFKIPDLYAKTQKIAEGAGNADMIQDLSDLSVLGLGNKEPIIKVGVNMALYEQAGIMSGEMGSLLAKVNGDRMSTNKLKITRDKAYTFVKLAVDEIRRNGQYAFYRNEDRRKGYSSKFLRRKNNNAVANSKTKEDTNNIKK